MKMTLTLDTDIATVIVIRDGGIQVLRPHEVLHVQQALDDYRAVANEPTYDPSAGFNL